MILFHHKAKDLRPQLTAWSYLALVMIFAFMTEYNTVVALTGLGVTLILGGLMLEINSPKVWADSKSWRKKASKLAWYRKPNELLYHVHILLLWPAVVLLGVYALCAAYTLA